jgi:hypothetical protein
MNNHHDAPQQDQSVTPPVVLSDSNKNNGTQASRVIGAIASKVAKISSSGPELATGDQTKDHDHVELQSSSELPISTEMLFGCSTGDHHHEIDLQILPPTPSKHSHGLSGIKEEFTGMSTPLSVVTEYRPRK